MSEHTPEPWEAKPIARGAFGIWDGINRLVAETRSTAGTYDKRPGSPSTPEAIEANAHLIAAAPETAAERDRLREVNAELLEALEHEDAMLSRVLREVKPLVYHGLLEAIALYRAEAQAAIAKAREEKA